MEDSPPRPPLLISSPHLLENPVRHLRIQRRVPLQHRGRVLEAPPHMGRQLPEVAAGADQPGHRGPPGVVEPELLRIPSRSRHSETS